MRHRKEFRAFGLNFVFGGMLTDGSYEDISARTDRPKHGKILDRFDMSQDIPDADCLPGCSPAYKTKLY
jgi:hypothetical protein